MFFKVKTAKIFCIGLNKTGTTSLGKAFEDLGFRVANQKTGELLLKQYKKREFQPILQFCKRFEFFQDVPFGSQFLFPILDEYFPGSKFILTVRDSSHQWYNSLLAFHKSHFHTLDTPTVSDLKKSEYSYPGWFWDLFEDVFNVTDDMPYEKSRLINVYNNHIANVQNYFRYKENLLVLNLKDQDSYKKLCEFIGRAPIYDKFPHISSMDIRSGKLRCKFLNAET